MPLRKIFVDGSTSLFRIALTENGSVEELCFVDTEQEARLGDVFIGRVSKVLKNGMAFVDIGQNNMGFIQLDDKKEQRTDLKQGAAVAVQIVKEAYDAKRAVLSTHISLNGDDGLAVLVLGESSAGVSSKINSAEERARLRAVAEEYSDNYGVIIRTAAEGVPECKIKNELDRLVERAEKIVRAERFTKPPARIEGKNELLEIVKQLYEENTQLVVNNPEHMEQLSIFKPVFYDKAVPLFAEYGIESAVNKLLQHRVWLKSGGYIVIDEAEALTVIDVNSGKASGNKALIKVNEEAVREIARALRVRNLCGMIVVDFISVGSLERIADLLRNALKQDRVMTKVIDATELGLIQITRQKQRKPLRSYIMTACPMCDGTGYIKNAAYIAGNILSEVQAIFADTIYDEVTVSADARVISAVEKQKQDIEKRFNKRLITKKIFVGRFDHYEIERSKSQN